MSVSMSSDFTRLMVPVAMKVLGEPNASLSNPREIRWGNHGSMSVDCHKGTWCDHENGSTGGGVLDFLRVQLKLDKPASLQWLHDHNYLPLAKRHAKQGRRVVERYDYHDEAGNLLYQVERYDPKSFSQRAPDGAGGWNWKTQGIRKVLYRLPEIRAAVARETIYIAEGEKGVAALGSIDLFATCSPGGAGKWTSEYSKSLAGADVVILPDNDEPGRRHGRQVLQALQNIARQVRIVELPDIGVGEDIANWIATGGTADELKMLARASVAPAEAETSNSALWFMGTEWDESAIPQRDWIARGYALRGNVTVISGAGAAGKSGLMVAYAVAAGLGRPFHRFEPQEPRRVMIYNVEDDVYEQRRRFSAVLRWFAAKPADLCDRVDVLGPNQVGTLLKCDAATGEITFWPAMEELEQRIERFRPDILVLDPLVELHTADENANTPLRAVMARFRSLAVKYRCAVILLHHTRKGTGAQAGDPDISRGASAIVGAARVVLTVSAMTESEAQKFGIAGDRRRHYFRVDGAKSNYAPLDEAEWFERQVYELANGDHVAAPVPWSLPVDVIDLDKRKAIEADVAKGQAPGVPWAPKLSRDARSVKTLFARHGIATDRGCKEMLASLKAAGFKTLRFKSATRVPAQGLCSPDELPHVAWIGPVEGAE